MHVVEDDLIVLGDCLYQRLYADEPYLTVASAAGADGADRAYGARLAIEGHDDNLLDAEAFARRLHDLADAADRVNALGDEALDDGADDDDRETLEFLLRPAAR